MLLFNTIHFLPTPRWTRLTLHAPLLFYTPLLTPFPTPNIHRLRIRRRTQLIAALDPHSLQLIFNLQFSSFPLVDFGELLTQLDEFLLNAGFF